MEMIEATREQSRDVTGVALINYLGEQVHGLHAGGRFYFQGREQKHFVHPGKREMRLRFARGMSAIQFLKEHDGLPLKLRRKLRSLKLVVPSSAATIAPQPEHDHAI